jgi:predicted RNase H-like HicB family nuclease
MKYYYAIFRKTSEAIEIEFPDLRGCVTFGGTWDEAVENATDVLAGWLAHAESQFIKKPSSYEELKGKFANEILIPIAIDEKTMQSYRHRSKISPRRSSRKTKTRKTSLRY